MATSIDVRYSMSILLFKIIVALLFSVPLLPFLLISEGSLHEAITSKDVVLAAPFVLEFLGFYMLHSFVEHRNKAFSNSEQKALLLLTVGIFLIGGIPVILVELFDTTPGVSKLAFLATMIYALVHLIVNTRRTYHSSGNIEQDFSRRYIVPGALALSMCIGLSLISATTINPIVAYYVIKNFTLLPKQS
jgi:hypothetical protein